jgi:hypothetical protein
VHRRHPQVVVEVLVLALEVAAVVEAAAVLVPA